MSAKNITPPDGTPAATGTVAAAAPLVVEDIYRDLSDAAQTIALTSPQPAGTGGLVGPGGALDLARVAEQSLARMLGVSAGSGAKRLLDRLGEVFPETQVNGTAGIAYRPLGAQPLDGPAGALISGAQAVYFRQAREVAERINELLDGLEPVVTDPDEELIAGLTSAYRRALQVVVEEYGREGGGAIRRILTVKDHLGHLRRELRKALGLEPGVNPDALAMAVLERETVEKTLDLLDKQTNYLTEHLRTDYETHVLRGNGSRFARLGWTIRAVPSSVAQVRAEFDALRVDEADRILHQVGADPTVNVELLLRWCVSAAQSWMEVLAEGRVIGLRSVQDEAKALADLLQILGADWGVKPGSRRLAPAIAELQSHVAGVAALAGQIVKGP